MTPFNNPSFAILMQVVLKPYKICWKLGPQNLSIVSIGTGSYRTKVLFEELGWSRNVKLALNSLLSMMGDTQTLALTQMQWLGHCPDPWEINSEIGDLRDELAPEQCWFRFMRYDIGLEEAWLRKKMKKNLSREVVASYRDMDNPDIIEKIYDLAVEAAEMQVKPKHFFPEREAQAQTGSA